MAHDFDIFKWTGKKRNSNLFCQKYWVIENLFGGKKCNERTNLIMSCPRAGIIKQEIQRDAFIYKFDQLGARWS